MPEEPLPRREPQQTEGARRDRAAAMSWTGRIFPPAEPCTDLALMARLLAALQNLPEQTDTDPTEPEGPP